jgi:deoxyribodipyrimidine photo-lyase
MLAYVKWVWVYFILKGKPEVEIQKIVEEYKVHKIFAEREVAGKRNEQKN